MGKVLVTLDLYETYNGGKNFFHIAETFRGPRLENELLRGIYRDEGVARIEFKNMANRIESVIPHKGLIAV